ncbi:DUF2161 family putative PD-(D/E)XK-type phosphodiesterase [Paenibacillus massiliensis]|uniref:DUF2161 family putative PD-(D/E)XK-type phosphodiesterase n=1 Tax=Paenibacillus massiliensis TaxID=225917 RepID=UPI0004727E48|nr:DUF2161 family putative PD-(D/E)XK-type phosphodiesterase [Paenibacillus massiliensis]
MAVQRETELYAPIKAFFEGRGYIIRGEVNNCDLVGLRENSQQPLIVEIKKTFSLALLLQGLQRLKLGGEVYLAVEKNRSKKGAVNQRWQELAELCRKLGLGLITVTLYKTKPALVEIICTPAIMQGQGHTAAAPRKGSRKERLIREFQARSGDYNEGGSTRRKLVTAYREKALRVASILASLKEASPAQIARAGAAADAASVLQKNYYGWFERVARGKYVLTAAGQGALEEYAAVLEAQIALSASCAAEAPTPYVTAPDERSLKNAEQ